MIHPSQSVSEKVLSLSQWEDDGGAPLDLPPNSAAGQINIGTTERTLSALAGGALLAVGLSRRSVPGLVTALIGGSLIYRGITGRCRIYDVLQMSTAGKTGRGGTRPEGDKRNDSPRRRPPAERGACSQGLGPAKVGTVLGPISAVVEETA